MLNQNQLEISLNYMAYTYLEETIGLNLGLNHSNEYYFSHNLKNCITIKASFRKAGHASSMTILINLGQFKE